MLDGLFQQALASSSRRAESVSEASLLERIDQTPQALDVYGALARTEKIKLIAEIKRASPSKGFLSEIPNPGELAKLYQLSGASAISVLTEESGFNGSLDDLVQVRKAASIPLLRKDFISTEYQILEARAAGADFILLILAWLPMQKYLELYRFAHELGMGVLVETHTPEEIDVANQSGAQLIGINTRNLENFRTDIGLFEQMAAALNPSSIKVAESSVTNLEDVIRYREAGADCVLVGEALVTGNPALLIPSFTSV